MKKLLNLFIPSPAELVLAFVLAVAALVVSCAIFGSGFHATAGKFLATTESTVDLTLKGYSLYVVQNNVPATSQAGVSNAYMIYRGVMMQASNAWMLNDQVAFSTASNLVVNARNNVLTSAQAAQIH